MAYSGAVSNSLQWLYDRFKLGLIVMCLALVLLYFTMNFGKTIWFVAFIAVAIVFIDRINPIPKVLAFLSDHSFELYLIHFPFIAKYGFVSGRKPLSLI